MKMIRVVAAVAALLLAVSAPAAALSTSTESSTLLLGSWNDCDSIVQTCHGVQVDLAAGGSATGDLACVTAYAAELVDETGYLIVDPVERGCVEVSSDDFAVAADGSTGSIGPLEVTLLACPNGGAPEDCVFSREVTITVALVGTASAISPQDKHNVFRTRDGRCVAIYQQSNTALDATGSISIDGTTYLVTAGIIALSTQTVRTTCD